MTNQKKVPASDERKRNSKRRYYTKKRAPKKAVSLPPVEQEKVRISFLGGMNEIGKNMTLYEYKNDMFIVDCGLAFPTAELPGVDLVIPDFTYAINNQDRIRGIIVTHGHEDHIGGLAYLLKKS